MQNFYIFGPTIRKSEYIGLWQIHPFTLFKKDLHKAGYNIIRTHARTCEEIDKLTVNLKQPDIIAIRPDWTENQKDVLNLCKKLRGQYLDSKIIMIDPFDQASSRFFESLPYLDAMLKYQTLKNKDLYLNNDYAGGVYAIQKLKDEFGLAPLGGWSVGSTVKEGQQHKIVTGNFIIEPELIDKISSPVSSWASGFNNKDLELFCHMSCGERGKPEWYGEHRIRAAELMNSLTNFNISVQAEYTGEPRIPRKEYIKRQKASKIVYSPLGWGEVTMRPFEALASRSLLIQPEIGHLDMFPNIWVPHETYIPIKWDLSDLVEKCEYYMSNEDKRAEIVNNAREVFLGEFTAQNFINRIESIISGS